MMDVQHSAYSPHSVMLYPPSGIEKRFCNNHFCFLKLNYMLIKKLMTATMALAAIIAVSCSKNHSGDNAVSKLSAEPVLHWNEVAYQAFGGPAYQHSLMASRINAMVQLAIHDALNGIEEKYSRWAFYGKDADADPVAATASAAYHVLLNELPARKSFLDSALAGAIQESNDAAAKEKGMALGKEAAAAVIAKRANDGSVGEAFNPVPPSETPGFYQAVPPFDIAFALHWENVIPFSLQAKNQFRSAPFPALNSQAYVDAFNEVKAAGKKESPVRTPDQSAYAKFWYEFSEAGWNRVARTVVANKKLNLLEAARLLALVDMAIADAYIAGWDSKIHYNFWRPFTAIRKAGIDGNDATLADASWEPAEPTPPIHDYPSTHSALGKAAATVLAQLLGDATPFSMTSPTAFPAGTTRSFNSFSQAADENADSRVQAGIHFRFSCDAGKELGNKIGLWTVENHLKPVK